MATKQELKAKIAALEAEVAVLRLMALQHPFQQIVPPYTPPAYPGTWPVVTYSVDTTTRPLAATS